MALPASFKQHGFVSANHVRPARGLMLSLEGPRDTGKTEFALSAPGPGIVLCLDRGFDAVLDNAAPPPTRRDDFGFKVVKVPKLTSATQDQFKEYWVSYRTSLYAALDNADARTIVMDGDSDSWELQRLAAFGKLAQVPPHLYSEANAARRALYARCYDSQKVVIGTSKVKKEYIDKVDPTTGRVIMGDGGKPESIWTGEYERQGFRDQTYVWAVELRCLYEPDKQGNMRHGVQVLSCKANMEMRGQRFWGDECNFESVMAALYPNVSADEWGF